MKIIKYFLFFVLLIIVFRNSAVPQAWIDNPNSDRIPYELWRKAQIYTPPSPMAVVTNSDGYDNFYLGVDFAEPHLSVNPRNPLWFFCAFNTNAPHYTLNGYDWFNSNANFGFSMQGDPVTAYDSLGNLYYENMYGGTGILGTKIIKSTNNGQTWLTAVQGNQGNDKNWIAADQTGGPYANYIYGIMTPGYFIRSTDQGASFPVTYTFSGQTLPGAMVCVGAYVQGGTDVPGGAVYAVTNGSTSFSPVFGFYVSTNGGASFSLQSQQQWANYVGTVQSNRHTVEYMRTRPYPFITADNSYGPYRGRLYCIYANNDPPQNGAKPDIYIRYSADRGISWSSPVKINDDPNTTANHQWHPAVWCDKNTGRLFVKWLDTRRCPTSDSCDVYASYSDNGGVTFSTNQRLTTQSFKIYCASCGGGGYPATYQGDYDAIASYGKTSMAVWADYRANTFGSYTAYFPDYAMKINPVSPYIKTGDSAFVKIYVPSVKSFTDRVKFTASLDTLPGTGSFDFSFVNGKDSISNFPDSVTLRIKCNGSVPPKTYVVNVVGRGPNGIPAHKRSYNLYANAYPVNIGTSRQGFCQYTVNGTTYSDNQTFVFPINASVSIGAVTPVTVGATRYIFKNWSDAGDTVHNITINNPAASYIANYKIQYRLVLNSTIGNTFGGNVYYDSAVAFTFGVLSRIYSTGGQTYQFRGWTGSGVGSYTSPDSTGNDSAVVLSMNNAVVEIARWQNITGITNISTEIPKEYKLAQNYPNPFNPATTINFDIIKAGNVKIIIYDALGREVTALVNEFMQPGYYKATYDAFGISSGVYFYKIVSNEFTSIRRMVLLK